MIHALENLFLVHQFRCRHIITRQFLTIIRESLELDTLGMREEEQIDGLMHRLQFHFALVIIFKNKSIVFGDDQTTQLPLGSLDAQLFEQGHTKGLQQKVAPTLCL